MAELLAFLLAFTAAYWFGFFKLLRDPRAPQD